MRPGISIIVPTYNCSENLKKLLQSIFVQSLQPDEIIIVDSSTDRSIEDLLTSITSELPLIYKRSVKKYPGENRNEGASTASHEWLAFLDVGTIPRENWLKINMKLAIDEKYDVVFGNTKYRALNNFQMLLRAATYGSMGHETTPGTLVQIKNFQKSGGFIEGIRAGEDQEWRLQIRDVCKKLTTPDDITLDYSSLPNSLFALQKKYFIYYMHSAKVSAQRNTRDVYLSVLLIFFSLVITQWNYLIGGWDTNPLFISNITKIYALSLVIMLLFYMAFRRLFKPPDQFNILNWFAKVFLFFILLFSVYYWNFYVVDWEEDSVLFIPHITKIYVALVFATSFLYRGVLLPLKLGIKGGFIFPKNWIIIGFMGLSLDLIKAPGIFLGILLSPFQKNLSKN
jgi:glycosyltransferase involved in cell wall biosynthesis|tara:strand:+ start:5157 stop:6347 length:1191 start_codon:yes stop_codon:yes gene_type:complete